MTTQPLLNLRVLVTRPQHQAQRFIDEIECLGGTAFHLPTIEITYSDRKAEFTNADLIIFTSVNAVIGAQADKEKDIATSDTALIAAIGKATADSLRAAGVNKILSPTQNTNSESLLDLLEPHIFPAMKIVIVRGDSGRDTLRDGLRELRAQVRYEQVYERKLPDRSGYTESASDLWQRARPQIVSISSDLGLHNLMSLLPSVLHQQIFSSPLVVNSERCKNTARNAGFTAEIVVANPPGDVGQIDQLTAYARSKRQTNT